LSFKNIAFCRFSGAPFPYYPFLPLQVTYQVWLTVSLALCVCQLSLFLNLSTSHFWLVLPLGAKKKIGIGEQSVTIRLLLFTYCVWLASNCLRAELLLQFFTLYFEHCPKGRGSNFQTTWTYAKDWYFRLMTANSDMFICAANAKP